MVALLLGALVAAVQPGCKPDATMLVRRAEIAAAEFDLAGAAALLAADTARECEDAHVAWLYARGLVDAQAAFREGAPPEALAPVREAIASLEAIAKGRPGTAAIARMVLQAAAAAAQSERDETRLYLDSALQMEALQRAAGQPGAPLVSAAEVAGDLWLQVHRYDDARRAYREAAGHRGFTARILAGLARSSRRLDDTAAACTAYRRLIDVWGARPGAPVELSEARAFVAGCPDGP